MGQQRGIAMETRAEERHFARLSLATTMKMDPRPD